MVPAQSILPVAPTGRHHLVKSDYSIARPELGDALADRMDDAADIIALVDWGLANHELRPFPVGTEHVSMIVSLE